MLLTYVYALRINFLRRRKLKIYRKSIKKNFGILRKMSELLVKSDVKEMTITEADERKIKA